MNTERIGRGWIATARIALTVVAIALVARWVDASEVWVRLSDLQARWVALALTISVAQVAVLAWRWRFTAARLGIDLPLRTALAEYYLGIFVNQVLPGGVLGDVGRAWRHAHTTTLTGPAIRAVILERVTAQIVMCLVAVVSVLFLPWATASTQAWVLGTAVVLAGVALWARPRPSASDTPSSRFWLDVDRACFARDALLPQLLSSVFVVGSYVAVFVVAARAVGVQTPLAGILPLVAPVLMTMLVPVTVAGWGVREAAAAALWGYVGLARSEGAAVSVAYGLLVLVSSAPGLLVLMRALFVDRGRRARPPRA
ncbi:MAG: lysylphosphatidylglycerol synthase transmembrane domain-containing protein [Longimicrobiales bacterium]